VLGLEAYALIDAHAIQMKAAADMQMQVEINKNIQQQHANAEKESEKETPAEPQAASGGNMKGSGSKPPGPVKANEAPGVTAGNQATDRHGNKLTGSGEAQINKTRSNTREKAGNKALKEGSGKVEHRSPKVGTRHFHATGNKERKKPGSTHHEF
jgi:hypothetical protein